MEETKLNSDIDVILYAQFNKELINTERFTLFQTKTYYQIT